MMVVRLLGKGEDQLYSVSEDEPVVSAISVWEFSLLVRKGRLELTIASDEWLAKAKSLPFLRIVPVDEHIALRANRLRGEFHEDPADRLIVATAIELDVPLVTKDERIRVYPHLDTIW